MARAAPSGSMAVMSRGVRAHAEAQQLGIDRCAASHGVIARLQDEHGRALAEDQAGTRFCENGRQVSVLSTRRASQPLNVPTVRQASVPPVSAIGAWPVLTI